MPPDDPYEAGPVEDEDGTVHWTRRRVRTTRARPSPARHRSEATIQASCLRILRQLGFAVPTTGSRYLPTGTPDILGCVEGRMLAVEVKRPGEKPAPAQLGQLSRWQDAGALAGWVTSEADLRELLARASDRGWVNDFASPGAAQDVKTGDPP